VPNIRLVPTRSGQAACRFQPLRFDIVVEGKMGSTAMATGNRTEWAAASNVQQRFMTFTPAMAPVDYSARCRQAGEVGGDCFDFVPLGGSRMALTVGDASGKGLPAALMISSVQSALRTAALFSGSGGAAMLGAVNRQVYATTLTDRYATLFYAVVDPAERSLRYVNAGHTPPLLLRRNGSVEWLETGGAPVGMFSEWPYEEALAPLECGDLIVACTDGVIEAESPSGEMWGVEGLQKAVEEGRSLSASHLVDFIFRRMDEFSAGHQTDAATVAVLRVQ
jgi:phosphoserine phosphatase RsbU/P